MILIKARRCLIGQTVQVELPRSNMVIDPRSNSHRHCRFKCTYHDNGTTVTLTRTDKTFNDDEWDDDDEFDLRVYDPVHETVPNFNSKTYMYLGVDGERAPYETTVLLIAPSVKTIKKMAFSQCHKIWKCIMHDGVQTIGESVFFECTSMKVIRLSRTLKVIEEFAFDSCMSLDALFLPSSVEKIDRIAFSLCRNMRILSLPLHIKLAQLGGDLGIIRQCDAFFETTQIQNYQIQCYGKFNFSEVHQSMLNFYRNLPPLHKACHDTNVTAQTINESIRNHGPAAPSTADHDGMTPLHILAMNPHADGGAIMTCFDANMSAAFVRDNRCQTPLDYLMEYDKLASHTSMVTALCVHRKN